MNFSKLNLKQWIWVVVILYVGVTVFINFSTKKTDEVIKQTVDSSPKTSAAEKDKTSTAQDNIEKLNQLKVLELKLAESKKRHAEALRLREVIEAQLKLRINLLKTSENRVNHLTELFNEGVLDDHDLELAKTQLRSIESTIKNTRSDATKINKYLDDQAKKMAKEEATLNEFKVQLNLNSLK